MASKGMEKAKELGLQLLDLVTGGKREHPPRKPSIDRKKKKESDRKRKW